jgi:putative drug exporter of the RND superfamily
LSSLLTVAASRRAKWIIALVWLVVMVVVGAGKLPAKFMDAEKNESTSFLPGNAESTKALERTKRLQGGEKAALVVVYHRDGGLKLKDRRRINKDRTQLNRLKLPKTSRFTLQVKSRDKATALYTAQITVDGESDTIRDVVDKVRDRVSNPGGGLQVKVTGPAGYSADAIKVFAHIDGALLLAGLGLILILLILIYRSPIFWLIPFFAVLFAELATRGVGYLLTEAGVTVNGQSSGILSVLVLGAGTDYALLLVSRYREELRKAEDKHEAMKRALGTAGPAIFASGMTVIAALLCLTLAELNGTAGLGPIGAMGIAVAMIAMLTLLPALLVIFGRRAFWPFIPRVGGEGSDETHGRWRRVGERVAARPRRFVVVTAVVLLVMSAGLLNFSNGLTSGNSFTQDVEAVQGQKLLEQGFPAGTNAPTQIVVPDAPRVEAVRAAVARVPGVDDVKAEVRGPREVQTIYQEGNDVLLNAVLKPEPFSTEAYALIPKIRKAAKAAGGKDTLVGGGTAVERDVRTSAARDSRLIVPIALLVVLLILIALLRAVVAPVMLIITVILSFAASLGVGAVVFDVIFGFPGSDPSLPLFAFVFLVALGIDYNIFLMARVREESAKHGTREGMLRGLAVTGGVITSAGIVLAGVFAVLGVLPLVFFAEIGFVIAFGVLLDTFIVRSLLVPALTFQLGPKIWKPSELAGKP